MAKLLEMKVVKRFLIFSAVLSVLLCGAAKSDGFDPFGGGGKSDGGGGYFDGEIDSSVVIPEVQFENEPITMVLQIISDATGWSIFPSDKASKVKISLWVKGLTSKQVLDTVVQISGLVSHREGDIITVMTYEEYAQHFGLKKEVVSLEHCDAETVAGVVNVFLSPMGKAVVHSKSDSLVLYDSEASLGEILEVIEKLDREGRGSVIKVVGLEYGDCREIAERLTEVFGIKQAKGEDVVSETVGIFDIESTNRLVIKGRESDVERVVELIEDLDTFVDSRTKHYRLSYVDAVEVYGAVEKIVSSRGGSGDDQMENARVGLLEKSNSIVLTGPPSVHRIMESLIRDIDIKMPYEGGLIRVYKIDNADVEEIAGVIRDLVSEDEDESENVETAKYAGVKGEKGGNSGIDVEDTGEYVYKIEPRVTVNKSTNSVIVQASGRVHRELEKLIEQLDKRRKQVLIKAMIVEVITDEGFDAGIEINHAGSDGLAFTSFGLSEIDPVSGARDLIVSPGGTAAVLRPDKIQAIIRALKSDSNAKVASAPQILVNDNAVGFTNSIEEEPTTEINSGETVSTTSFAGYVEAGTQFAITPHISEEGYLRVEYQITLNSFGAKSADSSVPPPRNTTSIQSEATVPDGSTIVVGGLQSSNESDSVDSVPLLSDIPVVGGLFKNSSRSKSRKTTYLFITPVIMDSDDFGDLKDVSGEAMDRIGEKGGNDE